MSFIIQFDTKELLVPSFLPKSIEWCQKVCGEDCKSGWNCEQRWPIFNIDPKSFNQHEKLLFTRSNQSVSNLRENLKANEKLKNEISPTISERKKQLFQDTVSFCGRIYLIENPPLSLYDRLLILLSQFMYFLECTKEDVVLLHSSNLIHLSHLPSEASSTTTLTICIKGMNTEKSMSIFLEVPDPYLKKKRVYIFIIPKKKVMDILTKDPLPLKHSISIICPHCMKKPLALAASTKFAFDDCINKILNGEVSTSCYADVLPKLIGLHNLIPEVSMFVINEIRYSDLKFEKELGQGSFATVYKAYTGENAVAVKKIKQDLFGKKEDILLLSKSMIFRENMFEQIKEINKESKLASFRQPKHRPKLAETKQEPKDLSMDFRIWNDFCKEIQMMCKLEHPNLTKLIGNFFLFICFFF